MATTISEYILLTGAGFTHNFGGFLADEMWAEIFNHPKIQQFELIKELMLDNFNYESIYHEILYEPTAKFPPPSKEAIKIVVLDAYKKLDESIKDFLAGNNGQNVDLPIAVDNLLNRFCGEKDVIGVFFTLNQDSLIERCYSNSKNRALNFPGLDDNVIPRSSLSLVDKYSYNFEEKDFITLKAKEDIETMSMNSLSTKEFNYIKLHGSFNWKSSNGSNMMVIGMDKESHISREPLLNCYFDIFKKILSLPKRKLLVIGYSFRDKHVNKIIADSVINHDLQLFVLSPERPQYFVDKFYLDRSSKESEEYPHGSSILKGLINYYPYTLQELLVDDSFKRIIGNYFSI